MELENENDEMSCETAVDLAEILIGYRPKTGSKLWSMYELLKEKREKESPDWHLVWNNCGWFHLVRTADLPVLERHGYAEVAIEK